MNVSLDNPRPYYIQYYPILSIFLFFLSYPKHPILPILSFRRLALDVFSWLKEFFQVLSLTTDSFHTLLLEPVPLFPCKNYLTLDFVFYIKHFILPVSLVSKHQNPGASPTQTARLGIWTPPVPAQVQCLRFLCGRKGQKESGIACGLKSWKPAHALSQSTMLCSPESGPWESTVTKDKGTKAPE